MSEVLLPCPFCGAPASIRPVARSWWKIVVDHPEACILSGRFDDAIVPQRDDDKAGLVEDWNTRAALAALTSAPAVPEAMTVWYCEDHPEHLMGHDGCNGCGIIEAARIPMLVRLLKIATQETREANQMRDDVVARVRAGKKGVQPGERGEG